MPSLLMSPRRVRSIPRSLCWLLFFSLAAGATAQEQKPGLKIADVLFEDTSGATFPNWEMKPEEDVVLSFRIEGFARQEAVNREGLREQRVSLRYQIEVRDPQGVPVEAPKSGEIVTSLSPQDANWRPKINFAAKVPASAPGGDYTVHIQAEDLIAHRNIERLVPFRVLAESLSAADSLRIAKIEYADSERGPWNPERYFSAAETVWVRYQISGYRVSPEKQVWVEQDWTVLDAEGKVVVAQSNASEENERSFYPPRFLATSFTLNLIQPKPGKYTLRIAARDRIGEQNVSADSDFYVRP